MLHTLFSALCFLFPLVLAARPDTLAPVEVFFDFSLCEGDTLWVNGTPYHTGRPSGTEVITGGASGGCDSIVYIDLRPVASPFLILKDTLCPDAGLIVNGTYYGRGNPSGLEILSGASYLGCDSLVLVDLSFHQIYLYAGPDQEAVMGDRVCLEPFIDMALADFSWFPPPPCAQPCTTFCIDTRTPEVLLYVLTATDVHGCTLIDSVRIVVGEESRVYIPNIFNPNTSDRFGVFADNSVAVLRQLRVFDRWGALVYAREDAALNDPDTGWDGTIAGRSAPEGAYVYHAVLERIDGRLLERTGTVVLVR